MTKLSAFDKHYKNCILGGMGMNLSKKTKVLCTCIWLATTAISAFGDVWDEVTHGYADNDGVNIHYATLGQGPLVVMIHGFPDFWYSWRHQMEGLSENFKVVAIDQRGYNLSDQPDGEESYNMEFLVSDVAAVIRHFGEDKATIVGHDWGGIVSWQFAFALPEMVENLVILNLPHPNGLARELASNSEQQANSAYARRFIEGSATDSDILFGSPMNAQSLAFWVADPDARQKYMEAFNNSDFDAMLAYYKQNYPRTSAENPNITPSPQLNVPLLVFHGLRDTALHSNGLNNTWDWNDKDTTIVSAPQANHFVQQDAAELVTSTLRWWLLSRQ